ncbi:uncharacterized protein LOC141787082 [Halichoeres trimaculatus]|uniref:uncharacterized protein LOC141786774 n=1 Tax=Halichoeres trimaculatus TaxID=147232 RepID=UPI003D9EFFA9
MPILARLLWQAAYDTLKPVPEITQVQVQALPKPSVPHVKPRLVVRGELVPPRPPVNPFTQWTTVQRGRKRKASGELAQSSGVVPKKWMVGKQVVKECTIPLTPVWFSAALLDEMEKLVPSHLPSPTGSTAVPNGKQKAVVERKKAAVSKRSRFVRQADAVPCVVSVTSRDTPTTVMQETVEEEVPASHRSPVTSSSPASPGSPGSPVSPASPACPASPLSPPTSHVQTPEVEGSDKQRTQRSSKGQSDGSPVSCVCTEQLPTAVVSGNVLRALTDERLDVNAAICCSVVAAIKHKISPVCTWSSRDLDQVRSEGSELYSFIAKESHSLAEKDKFFQLVEKHRVFSRKWRLELDRAEYIAATCSGEDLLYNRIQDLLNNSGMCLFSIDGSCTVIIQHNNYLVVVDCGRRDKSGFASSCGRSVAVFTTCLNDLMLHIRGLQKSLKGQCYAVVGMNLHELDGEVGVQNSTDIVDSVSEVKDSNVDVEVMDSVIQAEVSNVQVEDSKVEVSDTIVEAAYSEVQIQVAAEVQRSSSVTPVHRVGSVQGAFHQGDARFKNAGKQCMAISLLSLAKHTIQSVFSWQSHTLDEVLVSGDKLYSSLREKNLISDTRNQYLLATELPRQHVVFGKTFDFFYGDVVSGNVNDNDTQLVATRVQHTLKDGLGEMFCNYNTCLLTVCANSCAIIHQHGQYALVDSHARSQDGLVDSMGKSVVLYFSCLDELCHHIHRLTRTMTRHEKLFEIAGVCVSVSCPIICSNVCPQLSETVESRSTVFGSSFRESSSHLAGISGSSRGRLSKRKRSTGTFVSKKFRSRDVNDIDSDIEFVSDVSSEELLFSPLSDEVSQALCRKLKISSEKLHVASEFMNIGSLGTPCKNEKIAADGNCFFRAISQAVSGTQDYHRKVRLAVVKQLESNEVEYTSFLRSQYSSVTEYLTKSRIKYLGSWATELEIQAAADCLGVNIFTYCQDRWLQYSSRNTQLSNNSIYLENCNGNHYETVVCVQQPKSQRCYEYSAKYTIFIFEKKKEVT